MPQTSRVTGVGAAPRQLSYEQCASERQQRERDGQRRLNPRTIDDFALLRADLKLWKEAVSK